jgi:hypothetical protein
MSYYCKYPERNHLQEYSDVPCRLKPVLILHIWLDSYEDDMLPWVLSNVLIQRLYQNRQSAVLGVLHQPAEFGHAGVTLSGKILHQTKSSSSWRLLVRPIKTLTCSFNKDYDKPNHAGILSALTPDQAPVTRVQYQKRLYLEEKGPNHIPAMMIFREDSTQTTYLGQIVAPAASGTYSFDLPPLSGPVHRVHRVQRVRARFYAADWPAQQLTTNSRLTGAVVCLCCC